MTKFRLFILVAALLLTALVVLLLPGCSAEKHLARKIDKAKVVAYQNPESFADLCARLFPVVESSETTTEHKPADNKDYTQDIDSIVNHRMRDVEASMLDTTKQGIYYRGLLSKAATDVKRLRDLYKPCSPDTVSFTKIEYKENTARLTALGVVLAQEQGKTKKEAERANSAEITAKKRGKLNWYFGGAALLLLAWNFRRLILPRLFT